MLKMRNVQNKTNTYCLSCENTPTSTDRHTQSMKKEIKGVIEQNNKLKNDNHRLSHELSLIRIVLQSKQLERRNMVRVYENIINDLLANLQMRAEMEEQDDKYSDIGKSQNPEVEVEVQQQQQQQQVSDDSCEDMSQSWMSSVTDACKREIPESQELVPTVDLLKLNSTPRDYIINIEQMETQRFKAQNEESPIDCKSSESSSRIEYRKLMEKTVSNRRKIDKMLQKFAMKP